ncbi:type II toxin-antitoxin system RelE/ParE family toxin [candidate division WOR-3 bacterium]|nr:type II toxin-antitoxin system RelE/ParE family toxin [candidate division WOR-3 bacterium]
MARSIKWTKTAWSDIKEVADYIAKDSKYYAASFVEEVLQASRSLTYFAERGHIVPEFNESNIRELLVKRYRLIYKVSDKTVFIIAFIHSARQLQTLLENENRPKD